MFPRSLFVALSANTGRIFLCRRYHLSWHMKHVQESIFSSQPSVSIRRFSEFPTPYRWEKRPFILRCDEYRLNNVMPKAKHFDFVRFAETMLYFTDEDWKQHLSYLSHSGHFTLLPRNYSGEEVMWVALKNATKWLQKKLDSIKDVDYYHYLCFVRALMARYPEMETGRAIKVASNWFAKNYATLEWSAFFEIFKQLVVVCMRQDVKPSISNGLLTKIIAHGVKLVENAEIYDFLCLLRCVDYCTLLERRKGLEGKEYSALPIFQVMAKRNAPSNRDDLESCLSILAGYKKDKSIPVSWRSLLRRDAPFHHHSGWNWLRYSIESVFDHDDLKILRPTAALVAVRAYKWKAINFTPDDVVRFLQEAASPYLETPGPQLLFVKEDGFVQHPAVFLHLVVAIVSAADSDLPSLGKLPVRIDDQFWDKLVETLQEESLKNRKYFSILRWLTRELVFVTNHLLVKEAFLSYVSRPFDDRRYDIIQKLSIGGRQRYRQRRNYI